MVNGNVVNSVKAIKNTTIHKMSKGVWADRMWRLKGTNLSFWFVSRLFCWDTKWPKLPLTILNKSYEQQHDGSQNERSDHHFVTHDLQYCSVPFQKSARCVVKSCTSSVQGEIIVFLFITKCFVTDKTFSARSQTKYRLKVEWNTPRINIFTFPGRK